MNHIQLIALALALGGCVCHTAEGPLQWTTTRETVAGVPFERVDSRPTTEAELKASRVCEPWLPSGAPVAPVICSRIAGTGMTLCQ